MTTASQTGSAPDLAELREEIRWAAEASSRLRSGRIGQFATVCVYFALAGLCFCRLLVVSPAAAILFVFCATYVSIAAIPGIAAGMAAGYREWQRHRLQRTAASLSPEEAHRVLRSLGLHKANEPSADLLALAEPLITRAFSTPTRPTELVPTAAPVSRGSEPTPAGPAG